ncbi:MAG: O-antigen ligase family protein [Pyrinomonadaceae bacterium]
MRGSKHKVFDYEPVTRGVRRPEAEPDFAKPDLLDADAPISPKDSRSNGREVVQPQAQSAADPLYPAELKNWLIRRGHMLSFIGVFLFTIAVYLRPYELIPALQPLSTMAFWLAIFTILVFVPTQLGLEGNLTSRPREVNLLLLLTLAVLVSATLGDDPRGSLSSFVDFLKVVLIFIVMVNVIRTENRWKLLFVLLLAISCFLGGSALANYRSGLQLVDGNRVTGSIGNMFQSPNDMALHLVTMVPISVALFLSTRNPLMKVFYVVCVILMLAGILVSFSRGGLLGLAGAVGVMAWKLARHNRPLVMGATVILAAAFILAAPGGIASRFRSVFDQDKAGSAGKRKDDLKRSILVTVRHPLFGIGLGNYVLRSNQALATHNAYTQVSSEIGIAAMVLYVMFIITPLKRLRAVERETVANRKKSRYRYLAIGMQASLVGYMVCSFFASVAFLWYVYYLVAASVCLGRLYEIEQGIAVKGATKQDRELIAPAKEPRMAVF